MVEAVFFIGGSLRVGEREGREKERGREERGEGEGENAVSELS